MKGWYRMIAVNSTTARNHLKVLCDRATDCNETVIITRKSRKNVAVISKERFNELEKTERNTAFLKKLDRGLTQVRAGHGIEKTMDELEAMAEDGE